MDEIPGAPKEENFFDDGDDHILGRIEPGESADAYGLVEVSDEEIDRNLANSHYEREQVDRGPNMADDYDWRMVGRGQEPQAPKGLMAKSQNTGPKGVKRDYEIAKRNTAINRTFDQMRKERSLKLASQGMRNLHSAGDPDYEPDRFGNAAAEIAEASARARDDRPAATPADELRQRRIDALRAQQKQQQQQQQKEKAKQDSDREGRDEGSDLDSDEERNFQRYKAERLRQVQSSLPTFGNYVRAHEFDELAEMIKNQHELVRTVVHVYENTSKTCISLHLTFEAMAQQYQHVAFVRIRSSAAMQGAYDAKGLPTLLLYKGSKMTASLIAAATVLGEQPSDAAVATFLEKQGVLAMPTGGVEAITRRKRAEWDESYESGPKNSIRAGGTPAANTGVTGTTSYTTRVGVAAALDSDDDDVFGDDSD